MEIISRKAGLVSVNTTLVALAFPLFPMVMVYTTMLPTVAVVGEPSLATAGSAMVTFPLVRSPKLIVAVVPAPRLTVTLFSVVLI